MMAMKLLPLALLAVVGAETPECQADDVALLQEKVKSKPSKANVDFPDLGALKDALGNIVDQVTDFASKGIDQVTNKLGDALEAADNEVLVLQAKTNDSLEVFLAATSMNSSVAQNLTRFKKLANETVGKLVPLYKTISQQVSSGFSAAQTLLKPIGLHDEAEKLENAAKSARDYLSSMVDKATGTMTDLKKATEQNLAPTLAKLYENLKSARSTASSFTSDFDDIFKDFVDNLVEAVTKKLPGDQKETLGAKIQSSGETLTTKVHDLCEDVKKLVDGVSTSVESTAHTVDPSIEVSSPGFFGSIGNFFRRLFR